MIDRLYSKRVSRPVLPFEKKVVDADKVSIVDNYPVDDGNKILELSVDQFSGMDFMLNPNGFITNDIMMFEECQSDSVARSVLQRLKILHPESLDQNLTIDQMMARVVPANYGSPAEFVSAHKSMAEKAYKLYEADRAVYMQKVAEMDAQRQKADVSDLAKSVPNPE